MSRAPSPAGRRRSRPARPRSRPRRWGHQQLQPFLARVAGRRASRPRPARARRRSSAPAARRRSGSPPAPAPRGPCSASIAKSAWRSRRRTSKPAARLDIHSKSRSWLAALVTVRKWSSPSLWVKRSSRTPPSSRQSSEYWAPPIGILATSLERTAGGSSSACGPLASISPMLRARRKRRPPNALPCAPPGSACTEWASPSRQRKPGAGAGLRVAWMEGGCACRATLVGPLYHSTKAGVRSGPAPPRDGPSKLRRPAPRTCAAC